MDSIAILTGLLIGFAGSAHCAAICGCISTSLLMATAPAGEGVAARLSAMTLIQTGRALSYVIAGAAVGAIGGAFAQLAALAGAQAWLQVVAAIMLAWVGLSIIGLLPRRFQFDTYLAGAAARLAGASRLFYDASPLVAGMVWGFVPCGMVYNALLMAMAGGSAQAGAQFMAGFAVGTMPSILATTFGASSLARAGGLLQHRQWLRMAVGGGVVAFAAFSVFQSAGTAFCAVN
ncbi:sulfite exporter TauE/SafE family protein [Methyloligella solikamskensis]|uniref:Sulfite exporter TauE/SafE family protein n=1 Tax=Methyloligella solikamskensis TaxID=1177756 RepID=A0ABW3JEX6_9HYPH